MKNEFIYDKVNEMVFKELEKGIIPWKKPWKTSFPINMVSKKEYEGFNWWLLMITQETESYKSNVWATFKQIAEAKGSVKKGEHSTMIIYWKILEFETKEVDAKTGKNKVDQIPMLRYYNVFNLDQTEGLKVEEVKPLESNLTAEKVISNYAKQISIKYGGIRTFYSPKEDYIQIPDKQSFYGIAEFYATNFHEMTHSTGHKSRLNRFDENKEYNHTFGSEDYSKEELIAEMGSAYLCAKTKILPATVKNTSAYIQSWLKALKNDKTLLISAGGKAQKAVDYILKQPSPLT
jgi:antirestriction protein ArdC